MKRMVVLFMALLMTLSIAVPVASAAEVRNDDQYFVSDTTVTLAETPRILYTYKGNVVGGSLTVSVKPNAGWALWLNIKVVGHSAKITVWEGNRRVFGGTIEDGQAFNQKVVMSCSGRTYDITIDTSDGWGTVSGGIYQTEVL